MDEVEVKISYVLVSSMSQAPEMQIPTFPTMQLKYLLNAHFFRTPQSQLVTQAFCKKNLSFKSS